MCRQIQWYHDRTTPQGVHSAWFSGYNHRSAHGQDGIPENVRLTSVYSIKCLIQKQANGPACIDPWRTILVQGWIVPEQCEEVDDDEAKSSQCDLRIARSVLVSSRSGIKVSRGGLVEKRVIIQDSACSGKSSQHDCPVVLGICTYAMLIGNILMTTFV
jgi:hypothetical protein